MPFTDASGRVIPGSIAEMTKIEIGGIEQSVWFRGLSIGAPALILLHGGPGASESALFRSFVPELEHHFLVVYWEQRGTGRSYDSRMSADSLTIRRMLRDLDELIQYVRARFGTDRVLLLGHSWGTILGTRYAHEHPDRVSAYIGVAQIADFREGERISLSWALQQAQRHGDDRALEALRRIAPAPATVDEELELGRWVERFGGSLRGGLSTLKLIWAALRTDEASLVDLWKFGAGNRFSLEALRPQYSREDLTPLTDFRVPIVFMLGRHDWHVPSVLAADYFDDIDAPCKHLVWFDESAHNPPFEEPDAFVAAMVDTVLPLARQGCPAAPGVQAPRQER